MLASDIEWSDGSTIDVSGEKEVEMGEYRIYVGEDSRFDVRGDVVFRGSGDHSLFEIHGYFCPENGVEIYADGDNVVAVDLPGGEWAAKFVEIHAKGRNARAVRFTGTAESTVEICYIEAEGEGSKGIEAEGDIRLFLSSVSGRESAVSSEQGKLLLFESRVSPEPDATVIPALVVPDSRLEENGICIPAGSPVDELWEIIGEYDKVGWRFFSEELEFDTSYQLPAAWSGLPTEFTVPGTTFAGCVPADLPDWFPMEIDKLRIPIHVVNPGDPFIMSAEDAGSSAWLRFFQPIRDAQEIRVEYSADDKESWRDISDFSSSFITDMDASAGPLEPIRDYWFRLIVTGGPMEGISNEILFVGDAVRKSKQGGDRDHDDRDDQGEDPPHGEIIPSPEEESPDRNEPDVEEPDGKEPDTEGSGIKEPDTEEPGIKEPDTEEPGIKEPDVEGPGIKEPDVKERDTEESDVKKRDTEEPGIKERGTEKPDVKRPDTQEPGMEGTVPAGLGSTNQDAAEPDKPEGNKMADIKNHPPEAVTAQPGSNLYGTSEQANAAGSQDVSRFPHIRILWVLIPGIIILGGGAYGCWKRHKGKH